MNKERAGNTPMVSVIIPTRNRQDMLREALKSVLSQTYQDFEIIVVNDGGEDIIEIVDSLNREGKIAYFQHEDNRGVAAARNTALRAARGRYIAYLDDDDVYYSSHLETLVTVLEEGHYKVAYSDSYEILQAWITDRYVTIGERIAYSCDFDRERMLVSNYIPTLNIAHRLDILEEAGLFDEELESHEDWDLWIRLSRKYDFYHIRQVTAAFTKRVDNTSKTSSDSQAFLNTFRMVCSRYSHLVNDPQVLEAQKQVEWSLAMEVEAAKTTTIIADYERQHRYGFARDFVTDKRVLDLACGAGCGSFLISEEAASVVGIDPNDTNIIWACSRYVKENLEFIKGSVTEIPIEGEKLFDVIICFEAIGQITEPASLLREVKRLLKPYGLFIVSTPNRYFCEKGSGYKKPACAGGLYIDEFKAILSDNFKNTILWGQKVYPSSNIFPFSNGSVPTRGIVIERGENGFIFSSHDKKEAFSILAVASDGPVEDVTGESYLVDVSETLARHQGIHIANLEASVGDKNTHIANLEASVGDKDTHIANLEASVGDKDAYIANLRAALGEKDTHVGQLEQEIRATDRMIQEQARQIQAKDTHVHNIESELIMIKHSRAWRMAEFFRHLFYINLLGKFPLLQKGMLTISRKGIPEFFAKTKGYLRKNKDVATIGLIESDYDKWIKKNQLTDEMIGEIKRDIARFQYKPKVSIIMPVYNVGQIWLEKAINSVINQLYENWELCIADDGSTKEHIKKTLKRHSKKENRIRVRYLEENQGIAAASNEALSLATGEYIGLLDNDDELTIEALYENVKLLNKHPEADMIYSDEDKLDMNGNRCEPHFKPDWSPDMFLSGMYTCHFGVYSKSIVDKIGGFRKGYEGSQDYDLVLRLTEKTTNIFHIPAILYHWRKVPGSAANSTDAKDYAYVNAKKALSDYLRRNSIQGEVVDGNCGSYRVRREIKNDYKVSIIIPFKDQSEVLKTCVNSVIGRTKYREYEIILVNNQSEKEETFEYLDTIKDNPIFRILAYDKPFNFSAINNYAVSQIDSEYLVFLNSDTEVISPDWIEAMYEFAQRKDVGAVGALLYYSNDTIQHGGVILGIKGVAGHSHKHMKRDSPGYFGRIKMIHNLSAVTAACLMTKKSIFKEVGGFDVNLSHAFNDVDYCLKIREKGYLIVYTPYAELYHHESLSRGYEDTPEKQARFRKEIELIQGKWKDILANGDPYYNPNLTLDREDFSIRI